MRFQIVLNLAVSRPSQATCYPSLHLLFPHTLDSVICASFLESSTLSGVLENSDHHWYSHESLVLGMRQEDTLSDGRIHGSAVGMLDWTDCTSEAVEKSEYDLLLEPPDASSQDISSRHVSGTGKDAQTLLQGFHASSRVSHSQTRDPILGLIDDESHVLSENTGLLERRHAIQSPRAQLKAGLWALVEGGEIL